MRPLRVLLAALISAALLLVPDGASSRPTTSHHVFAPQAQPLGASYADWLADWLKWFQEIPFAESPVFPDSPRNCEVHDKVAFMGPSGVDGCTVPTGTAVGFTFMGWECSTAEGLGDTFAELRRCARRNFARDFGPDVIRLEVRVDGRSLPRPRRWTFTSTPMVVDLPPDNIWGVRAGPTKSIGHGVFYLVKPLPVGRHLVRARWLDPDTGNLMTRFDYRFTVRPRSG